MGIGDSRVHYGRILGIHEDLQEAGGGACGGLLCHYYLFDLLLYLLVVSSTKPTLVSRVFLARIQSYPITLDKLAEKRKEKRERSDKLELDDDDDNKVYQHTDRELLVHICQSLAIVHEMLSLLLEEAEPNEDE